MKIDVPVSTPQAGRSLRLDTLVRLRWLAVIGQTTAVLVVYFGLDYELPIWVCLSILLAIAFIGLHAWQVTEEARQLADALAATELVLAREQHLSQLDGLAAAAAHELGTPLATITVIGKELQLALKPGSKHA